MQPAVHNVRTDPQFRVFESDSDSESQVERSVVMFPNELKHVSTRNSVVTLSKQSETQREASRKSPP